MKTIGVIGGMSWQSSKVYYEYLNELVAGRLGGAHSAKILMSSVDFAEIERLTFEDDWDAIGDLMAEHERLLERAGADVVILATNTIHLVSQAIRRVLNVPFLHIAEATGAAIAEKGIGKIALLGTRFTMEKDFYTDILEQRFGLEVLIPDLAARERLQHIIYKELVTGTFTEAAKQECLLMIDALIAKGAEGVILGCTELPILIPANEVAIPSFDTTMIHARSAVDFALK